VAEGYSGVESCMLQSGHLIRDRDREENDSRMKDISSVFDHYRVSAKTIWNIAFWPDADFRNWDSVEQFDEIQKILFSELVLWKVAKVT
jgi:hypothetical protein